MLTDRYSGETAISFLHCVLRFSAGPPSPLPDQFDAVQELIAQNARGAQNQDDYNRRYDGMVSRYEATKVERDALTAEIRQRGIRRREFERFITTLESLTDEVKEFKDVTWIYMVDHVTGYGKNDIRFTLNSGAAVKA